MILLHLINKIEMEINLQPKVNSLTRCANLDSNTKISMEIQNKVHAQTKQLPISRMAASANTHSNRHNSLHWETIQMLLRLNHSNWSTLPMKPVEVASSLTLSLACAKANLISQRILSAQHQPNTTTSAQRASTLQDHSWRLWNSSQWSWSSMVFSFASLDPSTFQLLSPVWSSLSSPLLSVEVPPTSTWWPQKPKLQSSLVLQFLPSL